MNRLKELRHQADLTLRDLEKYVQIRNATLSAIEQGKQPFREIHILKLTAFFDVSTDYLLGYSPNGIGIYLNDDYVKISKSELEAIKEKEIVNEKIIDCALRPEVWKIVTPDQEKVLFTAKYTIYRSADISKDEANIDESIRRQVDTLLDTLDGRELEKVKRFIEDYIK